MGMTRLVLMCNRNKQVTHTGGPEGIVTQTTYIPELQLGLLY
jgi:hypothetical protein